MGMRRLLVALVLLAALAGLVWWSGKAKKAEADKPLASTSPKLMSVPEGQFQKIEIRKSGAETTIVEKDASGKWEITAPKRLPADQDSVSSMVSTLAALSSDKVVEEKAADWASFGLASPGLQVIVTKKDGKAHGVEIGDEAPASSGYFARVPGDARVFTVASFNKTSVDKSWQDLRDRRLLRFDSDKLIRIVLVSKGASIEFGKNAQNEWQILEPAPYRAESYQVEELIRRLRDAKMDTAVSDAEAKKAAAAYAGGTAVATARATDSSGSQQLQVRRDKDKNYYAASSVVEGIHKLTTDVGEGLDKGLDDFRNKKLFDFGWNDPSKIEIRQAGGSITYERSGDKWTLAGKHLDSTTMQTMIDKLRDLAALKFPDKGYAAPILEAAVTSNEGKRVERVGVSKTGSSCYAKRENEPPVYELDGKVVEELQKAIAGVKEAAPQQAGKK
jgi:ribosomal protein L12E/L44/L45/RPP1/RPP2